MQASVPQCYACVTFFSVAPTQWVLDHIPHEQFLKPANGLRLPVDAYPGVYELTIAVREERGQHIRVDVIFVSAAVLVGPGGAVRIVLVILRQRGEARRAAGWRGANAGRRARGREAERSGTGAKKLRVGMGARELGERVV
jgi:hypothetical protein